MKTRPCLTERLLMGRKESNQINKQQFCARSKCQRQGTALDDIITEIRTIPRGLVVSVSGYETREIGSIPGCALFFSVFLFFRFLANLVKLLHTSKMAL